MNERFSDKLKDEMSSLWLFAMRLSNDRSIAEELSQKTLLRALEKRHQYNEGTKLRSWLFSIMHSIWKNYLRKQTIRQKVNFSTIDVDSVSAQDNSAEDNLFFKQVMMELHQLPEAQRTVMMLVCVEGYSYKEAADILDLPEGTVMSRIARARLKVGETFKQARFVDKTKIKQKNRNNE